MKPIVTALDGDADSWIYVAFDSYALHDLKILTVVPVGRDKLSYCFGWLMFNQAQRVFTYEEFKLKSH